MKTEPGDSLKLYTYFRTPNSISFVGQGGYFSRKKAKFNSWGESHKNDLPR